MIRVPRDCLDCSIFKLMRFQQPLSLFHVSQRHLPQRIWGRSEQSLKANAREGARALTRPANLACPAEAPSRILLRSLRPPPAAPVEVTQNRRNRNRHHSRI